MDVAVFNLFLLRPTVTDFFGVQNFEFQYFRVFQKKNKILEGMKIFELWDFVDIFFWDITKLDCN